MENKQFEKLEKAWQVQKLKAHLWEAAYLGSIHIPWENIRAHIASAVLENTGGSIYDELGQN